MKVMLVSGGTVEDDFLLDCMEREHYEYLIAVDGGLGFFARNDMVPNHIVGDFDSVSQEVLKLYEGSGATIQRLNPMKDDTDTEHAFRMALSMDCESVHIFGVTGTRMDHVLSSIQLLSDGLKAGRECLILDSHNRIRLIDKNTRLYQREQFGTYVSLIPYTPQVTGLTLEGFLYPLTDYTMRNPYYEEGTPISGVSNEIIQETAQISLREGVLLVIESRD